MAVAAQWSEFYANDFVDISAALEGKIKALKAYHDEMRQWPHVRSFEAVKHLARCRGAAIGCAAAEPFVVGRDVWRDNR
jgi:LmbE family N-acetylglucosaminyl deacetylase